MNWYHTCNGTASAVVFGYAGRIIMGSPPLVALYAVMDLVGISENIILCNILWILHLYFPLSYSPTAVCPLNLPFTNRGLGAIPVIGKERYRSNSRSKLQRASLDIDPLLC
ncbi:hypothetical protein HOY80DRAFT_990161 [Tuber brumale]|nr:hypothetical protein HOY80DRAFT_990161 [Tuber brumale]